MINMRYMGYKTKIFIFTLSSFLMFESGKSEKYHNNLLKIYIENNVVVDEVTLTTSDLMLNELFQNAGVSNF